MDKCLILRNSKNLHQNKLTRDDFINTLKMGDWKRKTNIKSPIKNGQWGIRSEKGRT